MKSAILATLAFLLLQAGASTRTDWPQWRGPGGSGVSGETGLPAEWSPETNIRWKSPIPGRGHSSPVVWGDRLFVTTDVEGDVVPGARAVKHLQEGQEFKHPDSVGGDRRHTMRVLALDRETGRILWDKIAYEGTVYDDRHRKGSYASPTPATDGRHVYAWFGSEGLYCYDLAGNLIWKSSLGPIATVGMGVASSPVLHAGLVLLQCDEDNGEKSFVAGIDKDTGKQAWKTARPVQASWSTPLLVQGPDRIELVCSGNEWIVAYDPTGGKELWRAKGHGSNAIATPVAGHGMVFVSAGFPAKRTFAIRTGGTGELTGGTSIVWTYERGTAYVPSGILYGEYLYLMTDRGILTCLDAKTGTVRYDNGRVPFPATFTASPVACEGTLLLTSEDGDTFVVKAGPKYQLLRTNSIGEPVYASPAISQGMIFIRGERNVYCISSGRARG